MDTPKFLTEEKRGIVLSPKLKERESILESLLFVPTSMALVLPPLSCSLFFVIQFCMSLKQSDMILKSDFFSGVSLETLGTWICLTV